MATFYNLIFLYLFISNLLKLFSWRDEDAQLRGRRSLPHSHPAPEQYSRRRGQDGNLKPALPYLLHYLSQKAILFIKRRRSRGLVTRKALLIGPDRETPLLKKNLLDQLTQFNRGCAYASLQNN